MPRTDVVFLSLPFSPSLSLPRRRLDEHSAHHLSFPCLPPRCLPLSISYRQNSGERRNTHAPLSLSHALSFTCASFLSLFRAHPGIRGHRDAPHILPLLPSLYLSSALLRLVKRLHSLTALPPIPSPPARPAALSLCNVGTTHPRGPRLDAQRQPHWLLCCPGEGLLRQGESRGVFHCQP